MFQFLIEFISVLEKNRILMNSKELLNWSYLQGNDTSSDYVSLLSEGLPVHFAIVTLLAAVSILIICPANVLTVIVIIRNKELWTPCNVVLVINGLVQATGSVVYSIARSLSMHNFILPLNVYYKDIVFTVAWWTYAVMMRTGNNRLVNKIMLHSLYERVNIKLTNLESAKALPFPLIFL